MTPDGWTQAIHWTSATGALCIVAGSIWQTGQALGAYSGEIRSLGDQELRENADRYLKALGLGHVSPIKSLLVPFELILVIRRLPAFIRTYRAMLRNPATIAAKFKKADEDTPASFGALARVLGAWAFILAGATSILVGTVIQLILDYT